MPRRAIYETCSRVCFGRVSSARGIFGGRTEVTEMSGTGTEVVPNLPNCRVPVLKSYRNYPIVGYRCRVRIELNRHGVFGRVLRPH